MSGLFGAPSASANANANQAQGDTSKDVEVKDPPEDSVSDLSFSPQSEHLAVSSWDKKVRIYEIDGLGNSAGKAMFEHEGPVLSCAWSSDGTKVFGAGADKAARMFDVHSGQTTQVAAHDAPIRSIGVAEHSNSPLLITGSWDKTVKYWDLRSDRPAGVLTCQDRIYSLDVRDKLLVIGTADRWVDVVNLNEPGKFYKTMQSPLKWQTRCVSSFTDSTGYAVGSIEGRCAIQYIEEKDSNNSFSFKCHRKAGKDNADVFSVNAISFHPQHGTFSTAGSDGSFHFWDKDAKHRLKAFPETGQTISSTAFSRMGSIFAYACSYDWSKGFASHTPNSINKIMLHPVQGDEAKPRAKPKLR